MMKLVSLFENAKMSIRGVQKACSLMDRASVSLTGGCGFEAFAKIPPRLHLPLRHKFNPDYSKKNNQAISLMDRTSSLTVDSIFNINLYLNVSNGGFLFRS